MISRPGESWTGSAGFRDLLDLMSDAVLVLDRQARISFANSAALRALPCEAGHALAELRNVLGGPAVEWVHRQVLADGGPALPSPLAVLPSPPVVLPDGRRVQMAWQLLEGGRSVLRLQITAPDRLAVGGSVQTPRVRIGSGATSHLLQAFWNSAFPTTLQDASFRLVDVNQAFLDFSGYRREQLIGLDPLALQPKTDPTYQGAVRTRLAAEAGEIDLLHEPDRLLLDANGRELSFRMAQGMVLDEPEGRFYLGVLHDTTAERAAREVADRSARELDHWFELSPVGMLLYDAAGLLVRSNACFGRLVGSLPPLLSDAPPPVQALLGWNGRAPDASLQEGAPAQLREAWLSGADGTPRRLRATIASHLTPAGQRRFMAVVQDHSMEDQRDLARLQVGALMDTAGVGLATFQPSSGWVHQSASTRGEHADSAALQSIAREIVLPASLPEYDRLQDALRQARRAEVRYAIRHPELGERWLLTRVEPATLASGERTTSVVTLDVTEQQQSRSRSEQLLREMSTILESSTAGIALLRGNALVRCNQRFESMLGLTGEAMGQVGRPLSEVFPSSPQGQRIAADTLQALLEGVIYETEFELAADIGTGTDTPRWYALSVRRTGSAQPDGPVMTWSQIEAIAVLSDITRLKAQQRELELLARDRELMFSLSEVGIAFLRHDRIQRANDALAQLSGYPAAELAGLPQAALFPDATADAWAREEGALRQYGRWIGERRLRRGDGRSIWVQVSTRLVVDGDPVGGVIASYVNVDDRHRAEQALTMQAERTQRIIEATPMAITLRDARSLRVLQVNEAAARSVGIAQAELVGRTPEQVYSPEGAQARRRDMEATVARRAMTQAEYTWLHEGVTQIWDVRYIPLIDADAAGADQLLQVATDVTEQRAAQEARYEAAIAQREMLVKEVHHRIKNNLQGVAGLLQQIGARKPEIGEAIAEVIGQVQAIAQVYGLQVGVDGPLRVKSVVEAITSSVQKTFGATITLALAADHGPRWALPEAEAIPIALTINELLTNAIKHSAAHRGPAGEPARIACRLACDAEAVRLIIVNPGQLPAGFSLARVPGGVSGLGLVRALLPRRHASLTLEQQADEVVATITLQPPSVLRLDAD